MIMITLRFQSMGTMLAFAAAVAGFGIYGVCNALSSPSAVTQPAPLPPPPPSIRDAAPPDAVVSMPAIATPAAPVTVPQKQMLKQRKEKKKEKAPAPTRSGDPYD